MRFASSCVTLALGFISTFSWAQNCPLLGPAYLAATDVASPAFIAAKAKFDDAVASSTQINKEKVFFAVEIYSSGSKDAGSIHRYYNTPPAQNGAVNVGPDTLFRINSISKVVTVYTMLSKLSYKYWHEPVTKYIPELANAQPQDVSDVDWSEVTLGSLASQISGISRDYALRDASSVLPAVPGLRTLKDSEVVRCGSGLLKPGPCSRAESMRYVLQTWPLASSYRTPNYSNMAFQLLAYAVESITGTPFQDLVTEQILNPLNLTRTFVTHPGNDSNAVVVDGWDIDFGDLDPGAGYYSTLTDLTTLGRSILNSTLLPALTTHKWLKPITHTSSLRFSLGSPWEILRESVPVTTTQTQTTETRRVVDFYTKQGGGGDSYTSLLGLSPDHDLGISILTAGKGSETTMLALRQLFVDVWLAAAEQAGRDQAGVNFAGNYTLGDGDNNSSLVVLSLQPDEPALMLSAMVSNGTDVLELLRGTTGLGGEPGEARLWFYPMGLVAGGDCRKRIAFRAAAGLAGRSADENCASWATGDRLRWGNYPADELVFETGPDGKARAVEVPVLGATLKRVGPV